MLQLSFWTLLFLVLLLLSLLSYGVSLALSSILLFASAVVLSLELFMFLLKSKRRKVGKIKIEEVSFAKNFVFRSYFKPRDLWIVYDKREKKFRPADFRDMPLKVGVTIFIGLLFLYISYKIFSNLFYFPEIIVPRALILIILLVIGFYDFFIGSARVAALANKRNKFVSETLNKNRSLRNFIRRRNAYVEITPNLTLDGAVSSVEIITKKKYDTSRIEKILIDISRRIS